MQRLDPALDTADGAFARRVGAVILDLLLLAVVNGAVWAPLAVFGEAGSATASALGAITTFAYFTALEAHAGQTVGKKALGIVVVTEEGGPPDAAAVSVRNLLRFVDWLPAFYLLGAVVVAVTDRDQRLGDLVAETLVVRVADAADGEDPSVASGEDASAGSDPGAGPQSDAGPDATTDGEADATTDGETDATTDGGTNGSVE